LLQQREISNAVAWWLCGDGMRFVVRADEKLTAFMESESAICVSGDALYKN
jgi:hypothetical protein